MVENVPLAGPEAKSAATDRLFFAVRLDRAAAADAARLGRDMRIQYGLRGQLIAMERLHVTLSRLNDFNGLPDSIVARALDAGAAVSMNPFRVLFDRVGSYGGSGNHPLVLLGEDGMIGLFELHRRLEVAIRLAGLKAKSEGRRFNPHITLLRDVRAIEVQPVEPVSWTVSEFVLVHSLLGQSRYIILGRWPLGVKP